MPDIFSCNIGSYLLKHQSERHIIMAFNTSSYGIILRLILKKCEKCGIFFCWNHILFLFFQILLYMWLLMWKWYSPKQTKQNKLEKPWKITGLWIFVATFFHYLWGNIFVFSSRRKIFDLIGNNMLPTCDCSKNMIV